MKYLNISWLPAAAWTLLLVVLLAGCKKDEEALPITNDFRVLQVRNGNNVIATGATAISVIAELKLAFSHGVDATAFEQAFSMTPAANYTLSYDATKSFVTINFSTPLAYATSYTMALPKGTYGTQGEASTSDFSFSFTTAAFTAPGVTLTSSDLNFFEGETITMTASIATAILEEVTMDLVFAGTAIAGTDFTVSSNSITIAAGSSSGSVDITALNDPDLEGAETLEITLENLVNGAESQPQRLDLTLGDLPPALEIKGVMSLKIGGTGTNGRAIHLRVKEDIADLSDYGIGIANNGGGSDGREIDFPAVSVVTGDDILLVRDVDEAGLATYFGACYADFDQVIISDGLNFNGDDPFELYLGAIVIETFGDVEVSGTGLEWEYTGTWAYKLNEQWEYAQIDCSANSTTSLSSDCVYPFCMPLQLQGVLALLWDGSGTNGGKAVQLRANRAIADLSQYSLGVANNGGGTDGIEFTFPAAGVNEGDHIMVSREPATLAAYFGGCFDGFDLVVQSDAMSQNGDDAIELFDGMDVIETYGDANVDGTGQAWDYEGSWGFKVGSRWTYGGTNCATTSTTTQTSACPYAFCE